MDFILKKNAPGEAGLALLAKNQWQKPGMSLL